MSGPSAVPAGRAPSQMYNNNKQRETTEYSDILTSFLQQLNLPENLYKLASSTDLQYMRMYPLI